MNGASGRYAIVTGGSSGVGQQYAMQLASKGYNILLVSDDEAGNDRVANEIGANYQVNVEVLTLDLTQTASVDAIVEWVDVREIIVEVLVCNAGILAFGGITSVSSASLVRVIDLHCKIPTLLCREFAKRMSANGVGYILIMSSSTAWMPYPTIAAYSATKSYLKTFGRALYYEVRDKGIKVTIVFPGAIDTPFYTLDGRIRKCLLKWGIMLSPETVARKALHALFKGRHKCIPGVFTKICIGICAILPSWTLLPLLSIKKVRRLW